MTKWGARVAEALLLLLPFSIVAAQVEMTYDQYEKELSALQKREKDAKEQVASEQARIESLKNQNAEIADRIIGTRKEALAVLGVSENDVIAAQTEIASIHQNLEPLAGLTPDEARNRGAEIESQQSRIAALKKKPVSLLWKIRDLTLAAEDLAQRVKALAAAPAPAPVPAVAPQETAKSPTAAAASYTVRLTPGKHESLFRIAGQDSVFGDPEKWKLLYERNKEKIDKQYQLYLKRNPKAKVLHPEDLIFPGQILEIPR